MKGAIRKILDKQSALRIRNNIHYIMGRKYKKELKSSNGKKIFYMLVPTHGNLGDQAIAYASRRFLEDKFKNYEIIEINFVDTYKYTKAIKSIISEGDLIFLHGGGNMGNHYIHEEEARRHIIKEFKENIIVSFTQTIYFSNDEEGKSQFEKTKKVYNRNPNFSIIAREDKSYEIMKSNFIQNNIIKCPDIVFYLNNKIQNENYKRRNIMTCLRKDKETYIDLNSKERFINNIKENYNNVLISDTVINETVQKVQREEKLLKLWKDFYEAKVVITDRLHGMIFCAITKTPCIVTRSLDHKVIESYKWIQDLNYICVVDDLDFKKIEPIINEFTNLEYIDEFDFEKIYFSTLLQKIIK